MVHTACKMWGGELYTLPGDGGKEEVLHTARRWGKKGGGVAQCQQDGGEGKVMHSANKMGNAV